MKLTAFDRQNSGKRRFKFRQAVRTDVGRRRSENQDSYAVVHTSSASLFIVADGMGGSRGGRTASMIAVNLIARDAFEDDGTISEQSLQRAIEATNEEIFLRSRNDEKLAGMGTTVVAIAFVGNQAIAAHVGDSRAYRLHQQAFSQVTRDHSLIRELIDSGAMKGLNVDNHPIAHMLTRSLGPAREVEVEIQKLTPVVEPTDKFLLCCDGLHNLVNDEEIAEALTRRSTEDACEYLLRLALERGGTDNITIVIAEACALDSAPDVEVPADNDVVRVTSADFDFSVNPPSRQALQEAAAEDAHVAAHASRAQASHGSTFRPVVISVLLSLFFVATWMWYQDYAKNSDRVASSPSHNVTESDSPELTNELLTWKPEKPTNTSVAVTQLVPELAGTAAVNSTTTVRSAAPVESSNEIQKNDAVEEVISRALDLSIDDKPSVVLELTKNPQDKQLFWEHERITLDGQEVVGLFEPSQQGSNDSPPEVLLSTDEKSQLSQDKQKVREEIADIDAKLEMLLLEDEAQKQNKIAELEVRSSLLTQAQTQLESDKAIVAGEFDKWRTYEAQLTEDSAPDTLRVLAGVDEAARKKQELFDTVSRTYLKAVESWQNNQDDDKRAAQMASVGRDFRAQRAELPEFVKDRLTARLTTVGREYAEQELKATFLDLRRNRLNREIGFAKATKVTGFGPKKAKYERLVTNRDKAVKKLRDLQAKFPDKDELAFRRADAVAQLASRPVAERQAPTESPAASVTE